MFKKIKEHKFLVGIILIFAIRMILVSVQNPIFLYNAGNDDAHILGLAERMLSMDWLRAVYFINFKQGNIHINIYCSK